MFSVQSLWFDLSFNLIIDHYVKGQVLKVKYTVYMVTWAPISLSVQLRFAPAFVAEGEQ